MTPEQQAHERFDRVSAWIQSKVQIRALSLNDSEIYDLEIYWPPHVVRAMKRLHLDLVRTGIVRTADGSWAEANRILGRFLGVRGA